VAVGGEPVHVRPTLSDQDLRGPPVDPGDGVKEDYLGGERGDHLLDLGRQPLDGLLQVVDVGQDLPGQKSVMGPEASLQGLLEGRELLPEQALGQVGQTSGSRVPATRASTMARPDAPRTLEATEDSFTPAS